MKEGDDWDDLIKDIYTFPIGIEGWDKKRRRERRIQGMYVTPHREVCLLNIDVEGANEESLDEDYYMWEFVEIEYMGEVQRQT